LESCLCSSTSTCGLVLFYLSIGLTINYSLRLVFILCSSASHFAVTSSLTGASSFCKYPLWALSGISIFGGYVLISKYIIGCSVTCITDKRLIIGIALIGTVVGALLRGTRLKCTSLARYIGNSTSHISRVQRSMDGVILLESSPLSGFYLGRLAGTVRASSSSYIIFLRAVLLCFPLFLI